MVPLTSLGSIIDLALLHKAWPVHRQLRPHLPADVDSYVERIKKITANGVADMVVAVVDDKVVGVAVYRSYENTFDGTRYGFSCTSIR